VLLFFVTKFNSKIMSYSNAEAYDMLAAYFQCFENAVLASREYSRRYPDRRHHSRRVFSRLATRIRRTGRVQPVFETRRRRLVRTENNVINVLAYVEADPHLSIRDIARDLGISRESVRQILHDNKLHPYHMELHQALTAADFARRLNYCHWLGNVISEDAQFLRRILWTDEATFTNVGGVNLHNAHYWSQNNPHWMQEVDFQNRWSINVWCGIVEGKIVGPMIFNGTLTGERYLQFLMEELPVLLESISLETRINMW
jgi:hypothetical protein